MRYTNGYGLAGLGATDEQIRNKLAQMGKYCRQTKPCGTGKCSRLYFSKDIMEVDINLPGDLECGCGSCGDLRVKSSKNIMTSKQSSMYRM